MEYPERLFLYGPDIEVDNLLHWDIVRYWKSDVEYIRADLVSQMVGEHKDVDKDN